jgi:dUTP pyrophosphatase
MARKQLTITRPLPGTVDSLPEFFRTAKKHLDEAVEPAEELNEPSQGVCTIKVKKVHPDAVIPKLATFGAACFDLHAVDIYHHPVLPTTPLKVRTGLMFEIPPGYALMIYSRSGHGFKSNIRLSNCVGVIDSDYRGEVMVSLYRDQGVNDYGLASTVKISKGDRIAQAMLIPVPGVTFKEVTELSSTERGEGGFGSTG